VAGRVFDRLVFRPLMGWATAWSFDRLRLWIERGLEPEVVRRKSVLRAAFAVAVGVAAGTATRRLARMPDLKARIGAGLPALGAAAGAFALATGAHDTLLARRCLRRRPRGTQ
jgi:hypothetical protein